MQNNTQTALSLALCKQLKKIRQSLVTQIMQEGTRGRGGGGGGEEKKKKKKKSPTVATHS